MLFINNAIGEAKFKVLKKKTILNLFGIAKPKIDTSDFKKVLNNSLDERTENRIMVNQRGSDIISGFIITNSLRPFNNQHALPSYPTKKRRSSLHQWAPFYIINPIGRDLKLI